MRLELEHVTKRFGRFRALDDVTLTIESGRRVALIGPNGSGKSTLTRALMGLIRVEGSVRLDGRPAFRDRVALAPRLAYVPQVAPHLEAPVGDVLRTISDVRRLEPGQIEEVATALGLDLSTLHARPFRALSGGMKQKLLLSLALAAPVDLLVLDEPTASLDAAARERFFALYAERASQATLILSSHRLEEIRHLVDGVVALDEGRLVHAGAAADLLAHNALSVLEVRVDNGTYGDWLRETGFAPRLGGWWASTVTQQEKVHVLEQLTSKLGHKLQNVLVRDLETLEPPAEAGPTGRRTP